MQLSIHIDRPDARVYGEAAIRTALAGSAHPLPGAEVRYWVAQEWQVLEQGYDLPDVYVCSIEVETSGDADIPIRCPRHDLYGFFILRGGIRITAAGQQPDVLATEAGHYRLSYLPAAAYTCHFSTGSHHIFYFVAKAGVLFRKSSPELGYDIGPVEALRAKLGVPSVSTRLPMRGVADDAVRRFLRYPGTTYLRRYISIQTLMVTLLLEACEALHAQLPTGQVGQALAQRMRYYIDEQVADGGDVRTASVALRFAISYAYAKIVFKTHGGQAIGAYIRTRKLEVARRMLQAGEQPTQVAHYICWSYGHFSKAFKARYGVSPSSYRDTP